MSLQKLCHFLNYIDLNRDMELSNGPPIPLQETSPSVPVLRGMLPQPAAEGAPKALLRGQERRPAVGQVFLGTWQLLEGERFWELMDVQLIFQDEKSGRFKVSQWIVA